MSETVKTTSKISHLKSNLPTRLYHKYSQEIGAFLKSKFGEPPDSEDIVHSTFERFSRLEHQDKIENHRAFLYKIAQNLVLDFKRSEKTRQGYIDEKTSDPDISLDDREPSSVLNNKQKLALIDKAFMQLPAQQRQLFLLNRVHQMSYAEIARRCDMSQIEVKRQVAKAVLICGNALNHQAEVSAND
ncbi:RNA polymerase sigma factor [Pseudoalteromonas luteoviolacea]|uniref:RNA polymerase sigma factor n=1 Tax=Pseudoalteromonas luteoviolacea TaxID=43657 RepID=UPI000A8FFE93|nr:RNA polymerase sigma factor [Pseudoalteromonas luteoviolacea]